MRKRIIIEPTTGLFYIIVLLMFVGAMNRILTVVAMAGAMLCASLIAIRNNHRHNIVICNGILLLLILQNFCIGIGAHLMHNKDSSLQLLTQIPFLTTALIWLFTCVLSKERISPKPVKRWFVVLLFCTALSIAIGLGNIISAIVSLRNLTVFYMAYCIGRRNIRKREDLDQLVSFLVRSGVVLTIIGLIMWLGGYDLYKAIGIHEVYIAKAAGFAEGSLDGRFYTSLFSGKSFIRMGSLYYEPVSLGYYLSSCILCGLYYKGWAKRRIRIFLIAINGFGLLLTVGKGGYLITVAGIACVEVEKMIIGGVNGKKGKLFRKVIIGAAIIAGVVFIIYYTNHFGYAVLNHIWGIQRTWQNVLRRPWGYGLGTGGNVAQRFSSNAGDWLSTGGETALMSAMYQIGIQGVIALVCCFAAMSRTQRIGKEKITRLFVYIPYILLGVSLMQDNTFTPQCIIVFMLVQGANYYSKGNLNIEGLLYEST